MPWFIQLIGFMLLGTAVILGAVVALPYYIAKAAGHDQATCDCWDCQGRRTRAINKAKEAGRKPTVLAFPHYTPEQTPELRDPKDYWTTEELRTGYHVMVKGVVYEVGPIKTLSLQTGDCKVTLTNILTKASTFVVITQNMKRIKIWRKGFGKDIW